MQDQTKAGLLDPESEGITVFRALGSTQYHTREDVKSSAQLL
jgi:phosphoribosylformylglycinamidine (FGAM) synthase PurS component